MTKHSKFDVGMIDIPEDCYCNFVLFLNWSVDYLSLKYSNKMFLSCFDDKLHLYCTKNVEFKMKELPPSVKEYVLKLKIPENTVPYYRNFNQDILSKFPLLQTLIYNLKQCYGTLYRRDSNNNNNDDDDGTYIPVDNSYESLPEKITTLTIRGIAIGGLYAFKDALKNIKQLKIVNLAILDIELPDNLEKLSIKSNLAHQKYPLNSISNKLTKIQSFSFGINNYDTDHILIALPGKLEKLSLVFFDIKLTGRSNAIEFSHIQMTIKILKLKRFLFNATELYMFNTNISGLQYLKLSFCQFDNFKLFLEKIPVFVKSISIRSCRLKNFGDNFPICSYLKVKKTYFSKSDMDLVLSTQKQMQLLALDISLIKDGKIQLNFNARATIKKMILKGVFNDETFDIIIPRQIEVLEVYECPHLENNGGTFLRKFEYANLTTLEVCNCNMWKSLDALPSTLESLQLIQCPALNYKEIAKIDRLDIDNVLLACVGLNI